MRYDDEHQITSADRSLLRILRRIMARVVITFIALGLVAVGVISNYNDAISTIVGRDAYFSALRSVGVVAATGVVFYILVAYTPFYKAMPGPVFRWFRGEKSKSKKTKVVN